jgi:hypothetical protein
MTSYLEAYEPSVMDRARWWLADKARDLGLDSYEARNASETLLGRPFGRPQADGASNFVEGMGLLGSFGGTAPLTAKQAQEDFSAGEYGSAAANGLFAALEAAPGLAGLARMARGARGVAEVPQAAAQMAGIADHARTGGSYEIGDAMRDIGQARPAARSNGAPSALNIPDAGRVLARPIGPIEEAAADYMRSRGVDDFGPVGQYPEFDDARATRIAAAYDAMKHDPQNPLVRRAYDAMIEETMGQYRALKDLGIDFKFIPDGMDDPYARSPAMGYRDLVENGRLWVFPTDQGFGSGAGGLDVSSNPLLQRVGRVGDLQNATANDAFRVVHDVFGHYGPGNPFFRHQGEERAWLEHSRMYSDEARGAMTSETRGQNSWLNFGPYAEANRTALGADTVFADQKTGLMDPWTWYEGGLR